MNDATIFRQQCAAVGNGCQGALVWEELKARYRPGDELSLFGRRLLELNGWRVDHGKWVCGLHSAPAESAAELQELFDDSEGFKDRA